MAHPRPSSGLDPTSGELKNTLTQEAIDVMLDELHNFFAGWTAVEDFKVADNPGDPATQLTNQKLFISYKAPDDDRFLPAIVVRLSGLKEVRMDLGNVFEKLEDGGTRYGGIIEGTFQLTIGSISSVDLDRITDYIQLFLMIIKVPDLQRRGIWLYPNSMNISDIGPIKYTSTKPVLRNQVNIGCYLHWFLDVPDTNPTVTNIRIFLQTSAGAQAGLPPEEKCGGPSA